MPEYLELPPDALLPPLLPMREEIDGVAFAELVSDVRARGLLQNLAVSPEGDRYRLVAGWRRWKAALEAHLDRVPCTVRAMSPLVQKTTMLAENLHREAANPLDEARVFADLEDTEGLTTEEISQVTGKSPSYVASRLRLLRAPSDVRDALRANAINLSVALELARCLHDGDRDWLLHHAITGGAPADVVRGWVTKAIQDRTTYPDTPQRDPAQSPSQVLPEEQSLCQWHRELVPLSRLRALTVCADCFEQLEQVRQQLLKEEPGGEAPRPDAATG